MSAFSVMPPEAILFDCDGVLVDSEPVADRVLVANFARYGLVLDETQVHALFAGGTMKGAGQEAVQRGATLPANWLDEIYEELFAELARYTPPIAGVGDLLDRLDVAGIPYAIGSNGPFRKMDITLGQNSLLERFQGRLISAHVIGRAKPDPGVYLEAARILGVDPARTVVIDDSPSGVKAGVAAGARVLGFAPRSDPDRLAALGAEVFFKMSQVPDLIGI
ncbi:MAG: HAD-IA family hydrolase [Pseudomonadota bacterium]